VSAPLREGTEVGDARRRVESLIAGTPRGDDQAFREPWELRAFALAVAAYHAGQYEWSEFQLSLIESIRRWEADGAHEGEEPWSYYEHWLTALETVLAGSGLLSEANLDDRTKAVLATPKNANHHEAHREPVAIDPPVR
jgi:nitrile hydratase accessory protein